MLVVPKTVLPLYTLQNDLVRFDFGRGQGDFNWVGICQMHDKLETEPCRTLFNVTGLWEIVVVQPTRDPDTEDFRTVTPDSVSPTDTVEAITGGSRITLVWTGVQVDLDDTDPDADRLDVTVTIDLMDDEAFLRMRIEVQWSRNNRATDSPPGKWALWRVRFPIIEVSPNSAESCDEEFDDGLFVPEGQGVVVEAPTACGGGDPDLGVWEPQDRWLTFRNITRPGSSWRQHYPGKASSQVMGYYGRTSGSGMLVGLLDPAGYLKELAAGAQDGSIWFEVLQVPYWIYTIGNRPAGFTGSTEGDHTTAFRDLQSHLPQSEQTLPDLVELGPTPNARDIDVDGVVTPDLDDACVGLLHFGLVDLGTCGTNLNTLLNLGYESPYDAVIAPTRSVGPHGWSGIAKAWREIVQIPEAAFPLREKERNDQLPPAAVERSALLEIDATIHEGQESLFGIDEPDFETAYAVDDGILSDLQAVRDLIVPREILAPRAATSAVDVLEEGTEYVIRDILDVEGGDGTIVNVDDVGEEGRGYLRVYGKDGFYVAPQQVLENDWIGTAPSTGRLRFETFIPGEQGVRPGDIVRLVGRTLLDIQPQIGRATGVVASDSELFWSNGDNSQARIVIALGVDENTLVVGKYVAGELVPDVFFDTIGNTPGYSFEVEILRDELNAKLQSPVLLEDGTIRAEIRVQKAVINTIYPESSLDWAEVVEIEGVEFTFHRLYADVGFGFIEFDAGGRDASYFNGKVARVRRRVSPVDFRHLGVTEGDHAVLGGVTINERDHVIAFGVNDQPDALLSDGYLGFERPVVLEEPGDDPFTVSLYEPVSSAGRLLGPEVDIIGQGRRFVDTAVPAAGGFAAIAQEGDVLEITNAGLAANQAVFNVTEVPNGSTLLVDRDFVTESPSGSGFTYRILRRGHVVRVVRGGRRGFRSVRSGPRRVVVDGRDQVHFLSIGFLVNPSAPITGVFGVDSDAWGDLGVNPFVPATSQNLTTYRENSRGIRKPSQYFTISGIEGSVIRLARGWELEDSTFSVTFSDIGAKTFEKNAIQFRIVRDDRAVEAYQYDATQAAVGAWSEVLELQSLFVLIRGWQPKILGWDQPDFTPPRGRYLEMIAALQADVSTAIDPHQVRVGDEDGLYALYNLTAATYFNRFGSRVAQPSSGDEATGEQDDLVHPGVPFAREYLVQEVLGMLAEDGVKRFLLDRLEEGPREQFGSPHFFRPLRDEAGNVVATGDPTTFEVSFHGGGPAFAAGWRSVLSRVAAGYAITSPMDWLLGFVDYSSKDWGDIARSSPDAALPMPLDMSTIGDLADVTVTDTDFADSGLDFSALTAVLYGRERAIEVGDVVELLPSGVRYSIAAVGSSLTLDEAATLGSNTHYRVLLMRNVSHDCIIGASFFNFAFGAYATVAADVTFLANDISWEEVTEAIGTSITREEYDAAVSGALRRSLYRIGVNAIHGLIPKVTMQTEAGARVPPDRYGVLWTRPGSGSILDQRNTSFVHATGTSELIETHLLYLRTIGARLAPHADWFRLGSQDHSPPVVGATSLQIDGVVMGRGGEQTVVQSAAWRDDGGDLLFAFTHWAPPVVGGSTIESVTSSYVFSERDIATGYWTVVEVRAGVPNRWLGEVFDVPDAPDAEHELAFDITTFKTKLFLIYEQDVVIRRDEADVEVDRVLEVLAGRSLAAAFATIALDVAKGGSGNYVVVVHEGAIADELDIPSISGATIQMQRAADENPTIGESA